MNFEFSNISILINVAVRIITACLFLSVIIPLQIKEVNVKNGLKKLRIQLLVLGLVLFCINSIGLVIVIIRPFTNPMALQFVTEVITFFNSFGFLIVAYIYYKIYHQDYSPENKKLHEEIEKKEN